MNMKDSLVRTDVDCNNRNAFESAKQRVQVSFDLEPIGLLLDGHFGTYDIVGDAQKFAEKKCFFDDCRAAARLIQGGKLVSKVLVGREKSKHHTISLESKSL